MKDFHLVSIALFGSYAEGKANEDSDIDLLVEFKKGTPNLSRKKSLLKQKIKNQFHLDVDICREKYIKPYFKQQILDSAIYV
jgi:hypothetical protein|tara:strand:+ start:341 stop:586 length:246 start_codon:yes stop_codon:yes gene_type:complete